MQDPGDRKWKKKPMNSGRQKQEKITKKRMNFEVPMWVKGQRDFWRVVFEDFQCFLGCFNF